LRGMKLVKYLEVEVPELCKFATEIPKDLEEYIEGFDIIWSLPILEKYIQRRKIDEFIAFREILQNALDVEHEMYGYDNISVKVEVDRLGTHVIDRGKGISWRAFLIGGSDKPEWMRGHFGEGLDLATLMFGVKGHPVFFFTRDVVYKTVYHPKTDTFHVVFGRSKVYVRGTHVLIYKWKLPKDIQKVVYWKNNPDLTVIGEVMVKNMPNLVFRDESKKKKLYVRDIFVNIGENITGRPFYYSYNLWWVELDPNRTNVVSAYELARQIREVLVKVPEAFVEFIEKHLKRKEYGGVRYYRLDGIDNYYEGVISYDTFSENPYEVETKKLLQNLIKKKGISAYSYFSDLDAVTLVGHEGGVCLLVPGGMSPLFHDILPKAHEFVMDSVAKTVDQAKVVAENTLSVEPLKKLAKYRLVAKFVTERECLNKEIKVVPIVGRSHCVDNVAYIDLKSPMRVGIHEMAHALGYLLYGSAPDVSENFERCLEYMAQHILEMVEDEEYAWALKRIENGCVCAKPHRICRFRGYSVVSWYGYDERDLSEDPALILLGMERINELCLFPFSPRMSRIYRLANRIEEPYFKAFKIVSHNIQDVAKELVRLFFKGEEPNFEKYGGELKDIAEYIWRNLKRYSYYLLKYKDEGYKPVLVVYDLKEDKYKVEEEVKL